MLNNRTVQIVFVLLLMGMFLLDWKAGFSFYWYLILITFYIGFTVYGSYVIEANYFVRSVCNGNRRVKSIALTFDDGPVTKRTEQVLNILREQNAAAAFFIIGKNVEGKEDLLKRIDDEGHIIGNHSYSHNFWFSLKWPDVMLADINRCNDEIKKVTGKQANLFRPPYGVTNPMIAGAIKKGNYISVGWSLRTFDTTAKNGEKLMRKTLDKLKNGDVVLFHDHSLHTGDILNDFILAIRARGIEIVRVDKLLGIKAYI